MKRNKKKATALVAMMAVLAMGGACAIGAGYDPIPLKAEGFSASLPIDTPSESAPAQDSQPVEESSPEGEALKEEGDWGSQALQWISDKIVPLVGGVSLASIISAIVAIATAVSKHRGDAKNKVLIVNQDIKINELKEIQVKREEQEREMLEQIKETLDETSALMVQVANYAKTTAELVTEQNGDIEKVVRMKESIEVSCDLLAKSMALSKEAVKSGIAKDAKRVADRLKEGEGNV